jgi:GNAT superfamily N-acetyltransferase
MHQITSFTGSDAEYDTVVTVNRALYADDTSTTEELRHYDSSRNPEYLHRRYILRWDGAPVGHGVLYVSYWAYVPGKYGLYMAVHPEYQRRGIGSAFYDFALAELAKQEPAATRFQSYARTDTPQGIRFLEARSFTAVMRWPSWPGRGWRSSPRRSWPHEIRIGSGASSWSIARPPWTSPSPARPRPSASRNIAGWSSTTPTSAPNASLSRWTARRWWA